jgi:hypothetical protein
MGESSDIELRKLAIERITRRRRFRYHALAYAIGSIFLIVVWAVTEYHNAGGWPTGFRTGRMDHDWDPWIMYPLIAGTLALATHGWIAFRSEPATEREITREMERLRAST